MTPFRICLFLLLLWGGSASRPPGSVLLLHAPPDCLKFGTWGSDWPLCGRVHIKGKNRGGLAQRLTQELKLKLQADGTGEMSFYDCQTESRIPDPIQFSYTLADGRITFSWKGSAKKIWESSIAFNGKDNFKIACQNDTLFVDSLLQNTMYRGATYFIHRN